MKLAVLLAVLGLAASGQALKCYTCKSTSSIAGVSVAGALLSLISSAPPCTEFEASTPDNKKFLQECPTLNDKACMKITDPNDSRNQMRGCFPTARNECKDNSCFCTEDMCNGSERGWPSAVLLLAALAAALVRGR